MDGEKMINVPLDAATKAALDRRAALHGRASMREAQRILMEELGTLPGDNARGDGAGRDGPAPQEGGVSE